MTTDNRSANSTGTDTKQGFILVGRDLDEDEWSAGVERNERPRHYVFDLARQCELEVITPLQAKRRRTDRLLGVVVGSETTWAIARRAARSTKPSDFVYATDESIGIPYLLLGPHRRERAKSTAMFVLAPHRRRNRLMLFALRRLRLLPRMLVAGTPDVAQDLEDKIRSQRRSVDVLCLPVTIDDVFFAPSTESPETNERPLVVSAGLEQRDYQRLAEATRDLDVDVDVCAVSPDRAGSTRIPTSMPDNMRFAPLSIGGLRSLYQRADLFVLSTVPNTMGAGLTAVMEALACGIDVVVSIHEPDLGELVADGLVTRVPDASSEALARVISERLALRSERSKAPAVRLTHNGYVDTLANHFAEHTSLRIAAATRTQPNALPFGSRIDSALLSVIIPVGGADERIAAQLEALFSQQAKTPFEVIVSHNMPTAEERNRLTEIVAPFDNESLWIVEANFRASAAHARNTGAAAANGALLAFCDADDMVHPGWIDAIAAGLEHFDAVTGRVVEVAPPGQSSWRPPATPDALPTFHDAPYVLSGNLGVRREAFDTVGGFDETLTRCEDIAIGWALQNRGYSIGFAPDAVLDYHHRAGLGKMLKQHYYYGLGMAEVLAKYPNPLDREASQSKLHKRLTAIRPNSQPHSRSPISTLRRVAIGVGRVVGMVKRR